MAINSQTAFSSFNLIKNYNQMISPTGSNLVQVYHHYCGNSFPDFPLDEPGNLHFVKSTGFQPYLHYNSSSIQDLKSTPLVMSSALFSKRPRGEKKPIPEDQKDDRYYERRKRNNQAAKKSRDARKLREDQIALRAALLEHENAILRAQLLTLREETESLRQMIFTQKKSSEKSTPYLKEDCISMEENCATKWINTFNLCKKTLNRSDE